MKSSPRWNSASVTSRYHQIIKLLVRFKCSPFFVSLLSLVIKSYAIVIALKRNYIPWKLRLESPPYQLGVGGVRSSQHLLSVDSWQLTIGTIGKITGNSYLFQSSIICSLIDAALHCWQLKLPIVGAFRLRWQSVENIDVLWANIEESGRFVFLWSRYWTIQAHRVYVKFTLSKPKCWLWSCFSLEH